MELGGQMVNVNGYNVIPQQSALNLNQPLFLHVATGRWCTFAGVSGMGLNIRYLDGTYAYAVGPLDVANLGIQA
jgi:hypothetical protein